jgi:hypothetical protein
LVNSIKYNKADRLFTSMSKQVAKKPRSDASSNISMANDRALPVCKKQSERAPGSQRSFKRVAGK